MTTNTNGLFLITRPLLFVERRRSVPGSYNLLHEQPSAEERQAHPANE